jgi:hypothetical protein
MFAENFVYMNEAQLLVMPPFPSDDLMEELTDRIEDETDPHIGAIQVWRAIREQERLKIMLKV